MQNNRCPAKALKPQQQHEGIKDSQDLLQAYQKRRQKMMIILTLTPFRK